MGDTLAQGVTGEIVFMPVAVLAAHLAPAGREGTVYAIAMSILSVAWACSELCSGLLCEVLNITDSDYANLPLLMLVVAIAMLVPLLFLRFVPELSDAGLVEHENDNPSEHQDLLEEGDENSASP
jgi:MFS family permease